MRGCQHRRKRPRCSRAYEPYGPSRMIVRRSALYLAIVVVAACHRAPDPAALVSSAKGHMAKREYGTAVIQLKNALQKVPNNIEARYLLGVASLENDDFTSAYTEL